MINHYLYLLKHISQVEAGADIIAPSNMMDGFVAEIRKGLDNAGYYNIPIMSYGIKYASSFFGPFRDAVILHLLLVTERLTNGPESLRSIS